MNKTQTITLRNVSTPLWRAAKAQAAGQGETMINWIADAIKDKLKKGAKL